MCRQAGCATLMSTEMPVTPDIGEPMGLAAPGPSDPWRHEADELAAALRTNLLRGLSATEAAARLARFGPNRLAGARRVPAWRKLLGQFADPLIYLLLVAVVVSLVAWVLER